jgi:hypothetical protein
VFNLRDAFQECNPGIKRELPVVASRDFANKPKNANNLILRHLMKFRS